MLSSWKSAWSWILGRHISEQLPERERREFRLTINTQVVLICVNLVMWFVPVPPEEHGVLHLASTLFLVELITAWLLLRNRYALAAKALTLFAMCVHLSLIAFGLTTQHAHFFYPVVSLLSLLIFRNQNRFVRAVFAVLPIIILIIHQSYFMVLGGEAYYGPRPEEFTFDQVVLDLIFSQFILLFIVYQFIHARDRAEATLELEHQKSERLLLNILPREVAEELKAKGAAEPRLYKSTTICFTDFKGFTQIAESLAPAELVGELDRCFSYFDNLMSRHNLEKLKTIGDSYMFAGGIPVENRTHAVDCILAAIEIQAFMNQMKDIKERQGLPYWELRLGIHSGDLVAGVIGEKKFAYDVWSDTVNTASRCESSGVPGRINISAETYELVKDFFECEYRGAIEAKNKGKIEMYFVIGLRPELQSGGEERLPNEEFQRRYTELSQRS